MTGLAWLISDGLSEVLADGKGLLEFVVSSFMSVISEFLVVVSGVAFSDVFSETLSSELVGTSLSVTEGVWWRRAARSGFAALSSVGLSAETVFSRFAGVSDAWSSAWATPEAKKLSPTMTEATPTLNLRILKVSPFSKK